MIAAVLSFAYGSGLGASLVWAIQILRLVPGSWVGLPIPRWRVYAAIVAFALAWPVALPWLLVEARVSGARWR